MSHPTLSLSLVTLRTEFLCNTSQVPLISQIPNIITQSLDVIKIIKNKEELISSLLIRDVHLALCLTPFLSLCTFLISLVRFKSVLSFLSTRRVGVIFLTIKCPISHRSSRNKPWFLMNKDMIRDKNRWISHLSFQFDAEFGSISFKFSHVLQFVTYSILSFIEIDQFLIVRTFLRPCILDGTLLSCLSTWTGS